MRVWIFIAFLLGFASQAHAQGILGPEQFRDSVVEAVRQIAPDADVEVDGPLKLGILLADGIGMSVELDDLYQHYLADPSSGAALVAGWARASVGREFRGEAARDRIVALLQPRETFESASPSASVVIRPFVGDLVEVLVIDGGGMFRSVMLWELREMGVSAEEAWRLSRINISQRLGQTRLEPFIAGISAFSAASGLGPSALTDPAFCQSPNAAQRLFLVVDDETMLIADPSQGGDLPTLRDRLVRAGATASRTILTCRQGRLLDYDGV